jgi:hypothetical protein
MVTTRTVLIAALAFAAGSSPAVAQDLTHYRTFALGSSVAAVVAASGARGSDLRTTHARPAKIQEMYWRVSYTGSVGAQADPVRDVLFSFVDDALYQVIVTYYRDRMDGLTNADVVEVLSATYGTPALVQEGAPGSSPRMSADALIVARWEDAATMVTLTRSTYAPEFQLLLTSKVNAVAAGAAIEQALRLDALEAPQRALDQHTRDVADARVANQKARIVNKAAFKP